MLVNQPRRYQIPTHLDTPDKIDVPLFGITVSLTMRQGVCFLLGGSVVFNLWQNSLSLSGLLGLFVHWFVPFLLAFATYVFAVHEIRDRHLEEWILVLLHYRGRPKVFIWCSVLGERETAQEVEEIEERHALVTSDWNEEEGIR